MQAIKNYLTSGNSAGQQAQQVNNLYSYSLWKEGADDDEQWAHKAIEHIIKKLRKKKGAIEDLEFAIMNGHDNNNSNKRSKCVTIPRSVDGRLQVSHRKNLPHVIYCKVWRWPDVHSYHELRPVSYCLHPFEPFKTPPTTSNSNINTNSSSPADSTTTTICSSPTNRLSSTTDEILPPMEICINPYHYERIQVPSFPPILVPRIPVQQQNNMQQQPNYHYAATRFHPYAAAPTQYQQQQLKNTGHVLSAAAAHSQPQHSIVTMTPLSERTNKSAAIAVKFEAAEAARAAAEDQMDIVVESSNTLASAMIIPSQQQQQQQQCHAVQSPPQPYTGAAPSDNNSNIPSPGLAHYPHMLMQLNSPAMSMIGGGGGPSSVHTTAASSPSGLEHGQLSSGANSIVDGGGGASSPVLSSASSPLTRQHHNSMHAQLLLHQYQHDRSSSDEQQQMMLSNVDPYGNNSMQLISAPIPEVTVVPFQPIEMWCKIAYYELNVRVGDPFYTSKHVLVVDGFTAHTRHDDGRFCLGNLSQAGRNSTIEQTRRYIGKGVQLSYLGGNLNVECLSDCAVFVQSKLCNIQNSFHPSTVCKIPSGCSLNVFSLPHFAEVLRQTVRFGYEACYELTKTCFVRISFVKGWGSEYSRQDVTSCPCWIEIALEVRIQRELLQSRDFQWKTFLHAKQEPFRWLDCVLRQMDPPNNPITSMS